MHLSLGGRRAAKQTRDRVQGFWFRVSDLGSRFAAAVVLFGVICEVGSGYVNIIH